MKIESGEHKPKKLRSIIWGLIRLFLIIGNKEILNIHMQPDKINVYIKNGKGFKLKSIEM